MRLIVFAVLMLSAAVAQATPRSITVEWGYTPPTDPAVAGFRLYQEGVPVYWWAGLETRAGSCVVDITAATTIFTLTATFSDTTESPHSAPFAFTPDSPATVKFCWLKHGNHPVPMIKPGGVRLR